MKRTYTHCLTLRLTREMDELLTEASYDRRLTKSDWIRAAIRQSLNNQWTTKTTGARQ